MTPEQRFDRFERILTLMIKAGLRSRKQSREQYQKLTMLIDAQIRNEDLFARNEFKFATLAESQSHTDQRLDALIDIVHKQLDGEASSQIRVTH